MGSFLTPIYQALIKNNNPTQFNPYQELQYRNWVQQNNQPVNDPTFDMRGFYEARGLGIPNVKTSVNPYDNQTHYSDGFTNPLNNQYKSFKRAGSYEKFWEMVPENSYNDPNILMDARKLNVY